LVAESTLDEGRFRLGPVAPGEYLVFAVGLDVSTESVRATAGASEIELRLVPARELRIRVEGAQGGCELSIFGMHGGTSVFQRSACDGAIQRLAPGEYALVARSSGDRIGFLALALDDAFPPEVTVPVERGAQCTFVHRARGGTRGLRLRVDGALFPLPVGLVEALAPGAALTVLVPPRPLVAELLEGERVVARESLAPGPGQRVRVVLEPR
jgi:hypothetical protein